MHPALIEGLSDAVGFVGGALVGFWIARLLGIDPLAQGYGTGSIVGILFCGAGGGLGLHLARRWRASRKKGNGSP